VCEEQIMEPPSKKLKASCSCGRSSKSDVACIDDNFHKTKCPCYIAKRPCTSACICKKCGNTYGIRVPQQTKSRKRSKPELSTARVPDGQYVRNIGEDPIQGKWSDVETILLYSILSNESKERLCYRHELFCKEASKLKAKYFQIDPKTPREIYSKIKHSKSSRQWYDAILKTL
uniref:Tesmin/TSO1-like CXC domain-containing protein n=1 Tax=Clytia hemisphaerica TaxID=252671 RepID=A0A7M5XJ64_9CNID